MIADDGSSDGTAKFCADFSDFSVRFVTQADEGYRKSKILNEAIRSAHGEYLIFLDADVVLEKHFVEDHLRLSARDSFVCGRRVDLGAAITSQLTASQVRDGFFDRIRFSLIQSARAGDSTNWKPRASDQNSLATQDF